MSLRKEIIMILGFKKIKKKINKPSKQLID